MGKMMSVLGNRVVRPVKEFNLENRIFKEISKEKQVVAPRHESTARLIEESVRAQPDDIKRKLEEKDDVLLQRLRDVYVTSHDVTINSGPKRPLPTDRTVVSDPEYGFFEPKKVPYGKITMRDIVQVISKHQEDPELWTAKKLSLEYRLDMGLTEKVLQYFRTFVLIMPEDTKDTRVTMDKIKTIPFVALDSLKQLPASFTKGGKIGGKGDSNLANS